MPRMSCPRYPSSHWLVEDSFIEDWTANRHKDHSDKSYITELSPNATGR